jgi:N6-L-threonylcarbamoyladenine synthase
LAHFIDDDTKTKPDFPFLALTVSGGHTQIVRVNDFFDMTVIGETTDDAVGEAFDKTAKLLGLPYPGGPMIDRLAQSGNPKAFSFNKPKMDGYKFSFSGIKTGIMNFINNNKAVNPNFIEENLADICASVQHTLIEILLEKLELAIQETGIKNVAIGGGVSANSELRKRIGGLEQALGCKTFIPKFEYTTDNAAMIGIVGYQKYLKSDFTDEFVASKSRYAL